MPSFHAPSDIVAEPTQRTGEQPANLSAEGRNLMSVAHTSAVGSRCEARRVISSVEQKENFKLHGRAHLCWGVLLRVCFLVGRGREGGSVVVGACNVDIQPGTNKIHTRHITYHNCGPEISNIIRLTEEKSLSYTRHVRGRWDLWRETYFPKPASLHSRALAPSLMPTGPDD